jgi:hypothetical protein
VTRKIPIEQQISEVQRELALRRNVYPGFVARGKMRQGEADEHIARLEAVLTTLMWLRDNQAWVLASTPQSPLPPTNPA